MNQSYKLLKLNTGDDIVCKTEENLSLKDKIELSRNFLIKEICKSYNINNDDIIIDDKDMIH